MLRSLWRRWTANEDEVPPPPDEPTASHPDVQTIEAPAAVADPEPPPYNPDEWVLPFPDMQWDGQSAEDDTTVPDAAAEAAEVAADAMAESPVPHFAFVTAGVPGGDGARGGGWWLRAEAKPQRRYIAVVTKQVPALMKAWTFAGAAELAGPSAAKPLPRGEARIALLRNFRGRFDPDQVAGLLTRRL
jgi:hypothetical protein